MENQTNDQLSRAITLLRMIAEEHLADPHGVIEGTSKSTRLIPGFLMEVNEAEYFDKIDPISGSVINRRVRLKNRL